MYIYTQNDQKWQYKLIFVKKFSLKSMLLFWISIHERIQKEASQVHPEKSYQH